ncbi:hypothetical protein OROHE_010172 [Orobanche hederae]
MFPYQELVDEHSLQEQSLARGREANLHPNQPSVSTSYADVDEDECVHDCDFPEGILRYIDRMLMDEDMDDMTHVLQESSDFQAKERSFYELLGEKYPPSPLRLSALDNERPEYNHHNSSTSDNDYLTNTIFFYNSSSVSSPNGLNSVVSPRQTVDVASELVKCLHFEARGKKNHHRDENDWEEERSNNKLPAIYTEVDVPIEEFDDVLLDTVGERETRFEAYRKDLQKAGRMSIQAKKRNNKKKQVIDMRYLLINCSQSVAAEDSRTASELLKQIRQHSSLSGDGDQRLAYYFADGLEARLAGTGSRKHKALADNRPISSDYLKAYYTYLATSPFCKIAKYVSNKVITMKSGKATRVHIIDFGISYGFQWPPFIQHLGGREGGPPKLRITGIDYPQPGFRPAERIEDTGRRLAHYAKTFGVPFQYNAIAQKWETIKIEDLKIEEGEFVAVNCMYRATNLPDEVGVAESPRILVLNLIRQIKPDIFVHGILNGAYGVPFFVTRFREALFQFWALFDMMETNIPREKTERMLIERHIYGREVLNVIACEGWERTERPETYKQWQMRHLNASFVQVPFGRGLMDSANHKVRKLYHRDFLIDEDNEWLLMGWKGRIIHAISCWQPV